MGEAEVMGMTGSESTIRGAKKAGGLTEGSGKTGMVRWMVGLLSGLG